MSRKQRRAQEALGRRYSEKMTKILMEVKTLAKKVFHLDIKVEDIDVAMAKIESGVVVVVRHNEQVFAQVAAGNQDAGLVKLRDMLRAARPQQIESKVTEHGIIQTIG